jgi:hypothetical protein
MYIQLNFGSSNLKLISDFLFFKKYIFVGFDTGFKSFNYWINYYFFLNNDIILISYISTESVRY